MAITPRKISTRSMADPSLRTGARAVPATTYVVVPSCMVRRAKAAATPSEDSAACGAHIVSASGLAASTSLLRSACPSLVLGIDEQSA
jgi:hypothetical protein